MAFPQVAAVNGGITSAGTSHTVNLPADIDTDDLLLVFFASDGYPTITFPEGWTELFQVANATYVKFGAWYRIADGEEGATITVSTSASKNAAYTSYRITDYSGTPESGTATTGASTAPDPPSLTPAWGAEDTLWFAAQGNDSNKTVTGYPANYTNSRNDSSVSSLGAGVGTARRELNPGGAGGENPGAFTLSGSDQWVANTVAIQPEEEAPPELEVTTHSITNIQETSATLNGEITALGNGNADERGFVYATQSYDDPGDTAPVASEYNDNGDYIVNEPDPNGGFPAEAYDLPLTGLTEGTKYYVRAYAHNELGYAYGDEVDFTTTHKKAILEQVIFGGIHDFLLTLAAGYSPIAGGYFWLDDEGKRSQLVSAPGTFKKFRVEIDIAPGAGKSYTFTLRVDGENSALACTISGTDTSCEDNVHEVEVTAGQPIALQCIPENSPATVNHTSWTVEFEGDNANESLILGTALTTEYATKYASVSQGFAQAFTLEYFTYQIASTDGTIKNLYVKLGSSLGVDPEGYKFTLRVNDVSSDLTHTVTAPNTAGSDTEHEVVISAGDLLSLQIEPLNDPSVEGPYVNFGMTFVADVAGESLILGGSSDYLHETDTEYHCVWISIPSDPWQEEVATLQMGQTCTLKNLLVRVYWPPGNGDSLTFTIRKNGESTELTTTISGGASTGSDTEHEVSISDGDKISLQIDPTGSPAGINRAWWGLVGYIAPLPPQTIEPSAIAVTSTIQAPSATGSGSAPVTLSAIAAPSVIQAPSISGSGSASIAPSPIAAPSAIQSPQVVHTNQYILPSPVQASSAVQSPSVSGTGAVSVSPSPVVAPTAVQAPSISGSGAAFITSAPIAAPSAVQTPSVSPTGAAPVSPSPVQASSAVQAPSMSGSGVAPISPSPITAASAVQMPSIATGEQFIEPSPVSAPSSVQAPSISGSGAATITPSPISAISLIQSPALSGSGIATIASSPVAAVSAIQAPKISLIQFIVPSPVGVGSAIQSPILVGSGSALVSLPSVAAVAALQAPLIAGTGVATVSLLPVAAISVIVAPIISVALSYRYRYNVFTGNLDIIRA